MRASTSTTAALRLACLLTLAAFGCTKAMFEPLDGGQGSAGTGGGGSAGAGGDGQGGDGGIGGLGGTVVGGADGGGSGGSAAGSSGVGGSAGTGGSGGSGGSAGTGGSGGTAGNAGTGGRGGSGGTGGIGGGGGRGGSGGGGVMPTAAGQIVITELMHDSTVVSDDSGEWFEVYNPSTTVTYDLLGCEVRDLTPGTIINTNLVLPPQSFKTLAVSPTPGFTPDFVYTPPGNPPMPVVKFDNQAGDQAEIRCANVTIDVFSYPTSVAGISGRSFSVDPDHYNAADNDIMANWCAANNATPADAYNTNGAVSDYGTPGRANSQCP
jgi:hypothetical protein